MTAAPYAARLARPTIAFGAIAVTVSLVYALAIAASGGDILLLVPLLAAIVVVAVLAHPVAGLYALFGCALLFEQLSIAGLEPITQTRLFQNISTYAPLPLPLSIVDLLIGLTFASVALRAVAAGDGLRMGAFRWPVIAYTGVFFVGTAIGVARGGGFEPDVALNEMRGPLVLLVVYVLATNIIRERRQLSVLIALFVALVTVKAFQALLNYRDSLDLSYSLDAVTSKEDVVFFGAIAAMGLAVVVLRLRGRLAYFLLAAQPLVLAAELLSNRRTGFVALAVTLCAIALLTLFVEPRRGALVFGAGLLAIAAYAALFWDASGPLGEPIRSLRSVVDPSSVSVVDQSSDAWRVIENRNIAYTVRQLPLTGVGLGQQYLFQQEPSPLYGFLNWRYIAHNALLWLWLKAGPLGAFALWVLVARVLTVCAALYVRVRDAELRLVVALPITLLVSQIVFSSVDLGLTYMRTMIALGTALGMASFLSTSGAGQSAVAAPR